MKNVNTSIISTVGGHLLLLLLCLQPGWGPSGFAQSCSGVLGRAVVNQTFGQNGPFRLLPGQTTYKATNDCPNDGEYLVTSYFTCYGGEWHPIYEDHTPDDTKGNVLVINAAEGPGEFYNQPVAGLCYGTTYEFSVWVLNLMNNSPTNGCNTLEPVPIDPNLTMRVELPNGKVLQTIATGTLKRTTSPTWLRFATLFTLSGSENSVVIKLINNGPGGCGNDLVLDDIQLRPCRPPLQISFRETGATSLSLCADRSAAVESTLGGGNSAPAYQWQVSRDSLTWSAIGGANSPRFTAEAAAAGTLYYRLLSAPAANGALPTDTACSTVSNVLTVHTLAPGGCTGPQVYAPDAFTPNRDGSNDAFRVYFNEIGDAQLETFALRVYDRWGTVIFASAEVAQGWDGTYTEQPCNGDVYSWVIDCLLTDGTRKKQFTRQGRVLLIR